MEAANRTLFLKDTLTKQLNARDGSWDNDDMTPIGDWDSASQALELIIDQGEGTTGDHEHSHYNVFAQIVADQLEYYDVVENIDSKDYEHETFHKVRLHLLGIE